MNLKLIGSSLVILAAMFPLADNIINYFFDESFGIEIAKKIGYSSFFNFLYLTGAAITPILLSIASRLRAYFVTYIVVVFTYSADFFWIFSDHYSSYDFSYLYAVLFTLGFVITAYFLDKNIKNELSRNRLIETLLKAKHKINKHDE